MDISPERVTDQLTEQVASIKVAPDPPSDFERFWRTVRDELQRVPANLELAPDDVPRHGREEGLRRYVWRADSLDGRRIAGPVIFPMEGSGEQPAPVWVYSHGYGSVNSGAAWRPDLARLGFIALGLDARGYHRSRRPGDPGIPGWAVRGIERRESYILRGAVADLMRAVEVARSLSGADGRRTVLGGESFGGGLAVLAAPWIADLTYLAVSVPTFGAYALRRTLVKQGSGSEINALLGQMSTDEAAALTERLRTFDAVNAAALIKDVPATVGLGVSDIVVPGETVAAIYHALATPDKELLCYPCSHSAHPLTREWRRFQAHIEGRALALCAR